MNQQNKKPDSFRDVVDFSEPSRNVIVINKEGKVVSVATSEKKPSVATSEKKPSVANVWKQRAEKAERLAAERLAAEEAARLAARLAAERLAAAEEAERQAARLAAAEEAERQAARLAAAERQAARLAAAEEAARLAAAEEAARLAAAERLAVEEGASRLATERLAAAEEAARLAAAERLAVEEGASRLATERLAAAEAATRSFYVENKAHLREIARQIVEGIYFLIDRYRHIYHIIYYFTSLIGGSVLDLYSELSGTPLDSDQLLLTSDYDITSLLHLTNNTHGTINFIERIYQSHLIGTILPLFKKYYDITFVKSVNHDVYGSNYKYIHNIHNVFLYKNISDNYINFKIVIVKEGFELSLFDINFVNPHDKLHQYLTPINITNISGLPVPDPITYIKIMMHSMISRGNNAMETTRIKCIKDFKRLEYFINKMFYKTSINVFKPRTGIFIGYDRTKQIKDYISDLQKYYSNLFELLHIQFPWCNSSRNIKSFASVLMAPASAAAAASSDQQATPVESFKYSQDVGELYFYIENPNQSSLESITKLIQPSGNVGPSSKQGGGKTIEMFHHCY